MIDNDYSCSQEEAREIIYGDNEDFDVVYRQIVDNSRWSVEYECVVKNNKNNTYWMTYYSVGATEQQDERPFEYSDPFFFRVEPKEVTKIEYVKC